MSKVEIHYRRPPDRLDIFVQDLVVEEPGYRITLHDPSTLSAPLSVGDRTIYEPGAPIVWFVFPDAWFDVGRFHLLDGTLTGYYVNFIAPPDLSGRVWSMYDLCLDVWIEPDGAFHVLDREEFDEAVDRHWIDPATAERVRLDLRRLIADLNAGRWPRGPVRDYDLERVRGLRGGCD